MNKKIMVTIFILILITAGLSGCFGNDEGKKGSSGPSYSEAVGEYPAETGWIQSEGDLSTDQNGPYLIADGTISIILNNTNVYAITIEISFDDYDAAHASTDSASPADDIEISIGGGFNDTGSGTTPTTQRFDLMGNVTQGGETESLPSEITFDVHAICYCETTYPMTGRPSAIILATRDQGVAYEISATYQYLEEEE